MMPKAKPFPPKKKGDEKDKKKAKKGKKPMPWGKY